MIDPGLDWTCELRAEGLVLTPRTAPLTARIVYRERAGMLAAAEDIVDRLPVPAGYRVEHRSHPQRFVTVEGEHAVMLDEIGTAGGAARVRDIAIVYGDDFHSTIVGVARDALARPAAREEVRRLAEHDAYMLGRRRRRYVFEPPAGWQALATGSLEVTFVAPDYPRDHALLTVHPALPRSEIESAESFVHALAGRLGATATGDDEWWRLDAGDARRTVFVGEDREYVYPAVLEHAPARGHDELRRLASTIEAVPRGGGRSHVAAAACLAHWTE